MNDEELREFNKNRVIFQLGIVVADLDRAIEAWTRVFRAGPWRHATLSNKSMTNMVIGKGSIDRETCDYRVALTMVGDLQIELIEANASTPIYLDFLKKTGGGLHHIKEKIADADMDAELARYRELGMPDIWGANYYNVTFHYPDTVEGLGVQVELGNCETAVIPPDAKS